MPALASPALGILFAIGAATLQFVLWPFLRPYAWVFFYPVVLASSWVGGVRAGLLATLTAATLVGILFVKPELAENAGYARESLAICIHIVTGAAVSVLCQRIRNSLRTITELNRKLELRERQRSAELELSRRQGEAGAARFISIVNSAMDAIISVDGQQRIVLFNQAAEKLFGYPADQILGQPLERLIPERFRPTHGHHLNEFVKSGVTSRSKSALGRLSGLKANGQEFPIEGSISQVEVLGEHILTVILRDLSERMRAEAALKESEARLQAVTENLSEGLIVCDPDGNLLHWNRAGLQMHDFSDLSDGLAHLPSFEQIFELRSPEGEVLAYDEWPLPRILRGDTIRDLPLRLRRAGASWERLFSYSGSLIKDAEGRELGFLSVYDITEQAAAQARLRESEARFAAFMDSCPAPAWMKDPHGRYLYTSKSWQREFAAAGQEWLGRTDRELFPPAAADRFADSDRKALASGTPIEVEAQSGPPYWNILAFSFLTDAQPMVGGFAMDLTREKLAQAEVRQLNTELEKRVEERTAQLLAANGELEAFSYSVSHDLRAPVRALTGFSRALQEDYGEHLPQEAQEYVATINRSADRMGQLIDDLLAFARLSRVPLRRREVNMQSLVGTVIAAELKAYPQRDRAKVDVHPLPPAHGDLSLLRQVWTNLVSNALKYSARNSEPRVEIGCLQQPQGSVYFIRDNGTGFDMRYAHKVFGVFQRLHRSEEYEGTGVGLAIVKRIVERHGGEIWVESEPDRGARFFFTVSGGAENV